MRHNASIHWEEGDVKHTLPVRATIMYETTMVNHYNSLGLYDGVRCDAEIIIQGTPIDKVPHKHNNMFVRRDGVSYKVRELRPYKSHGVEAISIVALEVSSE